MDALRKHGWPLILLLALTGCIGTRSTLPPAVGTAKPSLDPTELPAAQAMQASLAVAEKLDRAGNEAAAIDQYEKVMRLDPKNAQVARRLAVLHDRRGEFAKADVEYRKATTALPRDADLLNDWGYSYYLRNNWSEAETKLRQALKVDPRHTRARCNLGLVLGQQGRYPEAMKTFREAQLSEAEAHSNLGFVYWTQGKLDEARQQCRLALQKDSGCNKSLELLTQLDRPARPAADVVTASHDRPKAVQAKPAVMPAEAKVQEPANVIYRSPSGVRWAPVTPTEKAEQPR